VLSSKACIRWHQYHHVHVTLPQRPLSYLGVFEATSQYGSYSGIEEFARAAGRQPNVVSYYSGWNEQFQLPFARLAAAHGAIPLVQINPEIDPGHGVIWLSDIASGRYDAYLTNYADQVATYGKAVIISFGHEFNGSWYPWGWRHQSPQEFAAAWRHIVDVFRRQGADNVTWLWDANVTGSKSPAALSQWWPGPGYVTWAGVDGYYRKTDDTWSSVFGPTIAQVQQITSAPILIAETAIGPLGTEPWQLSDLYASIRQSKSYLGLVWFDENKPGLLYRLEDPGQNAALIRQTFQQETQPWRLAHQRGPDTTKAVSATPAADAD
jgi:hypothetical protein